jgi:hypothetical protein
MMNAHALVVGISQYQQVRPLPPQVLNDAADIAALLQDERRAGYPAFQVRLLPEAEATRAGLLEALEALARAADEDSAVFIYISAHGGRLARGPHAGEYLLPIDTDASSETAFTRTALSGQELGAALRAIPARRKLVIFDCCHAAGVVKSQEGLALKSGLPGSYYHALVAGEGMVVLASCGSEELSVVMPGDRNSLFTKHLLEGLSGAVPAKEGMVKVFDLFEYTQRRVVDANPRQNPVFQTPGLKGNFAVALHPGGEATKALKASGPQFDAFLSFVDQEPDAKWVYEELLPRLKAEGLRVVTDADTSQSMYRVVGIERGIEQSKRTVVVLSPQYLADGSAQFQNVLALEEHFRRPEHRLLPIQVQPIPREALPLRFQALVMLDVTHRYRGREALDKLVRELKSA